ncbi:serine/threonine-protein kinase 11-interacting protein isoform X3 [Phlebotomus argentipes]|uniref:serine/threonine-protein kinase 11-interacting protein isoform X3 n=1 Tax=Phlebotomus argentipes TaxID=94469 RepID=UPI00289377CE|nr:serine/threonine-protein kinase 11-interacting protein isoform X3 [Phlebotomus argentipes]
MDPSKITSLATLLRDNGHKILSGEAKLTLSGSLIRALNDSFSLIVDENADKCSPHTFYVCKPNYSKSDVFRDLQFIFDFVQKTIHLCVNQLHGDDQTDDVVDLTNFRTLEKLEINKVALRKFRGIQRMRAQLQEVVCVKCLSSIRELFLDCGGDKCGGFVWNELKSANFSGNILKSLDRSLELTPWLQNLTLSHNQLEKIPEIRLLPNLKMLDVSFNLLTEMPNFHPEASRRLQMLNMRNNLLENVTGVSCLDGLYELDVGGNFLIDHSSLLPLCTLAALRYLNLLGNPLAFHPKHREATARYLHGNTASIKFVLDSSHLSKHEKSLTGAYSSYHPILMRSAHSESPWAIQGRRSNTNEGSSVATSLGSTSSFQITTEVPMDRSIAESTSSHRKLRVRNAQIADNPEPKSITTNIDATIEGRNKEHLKTKEQIENLREQFGDSWLHREGASLVKSVIGGFPEDNKTQGSILEKNALVAELYSEPLIAEPMAEVEEESAKQSTPKEEGLIMRQSPTESPIKAASDAEEQTKDLNNLETIYKTAKSNPSIEITSDYTTAIEEESDPEDNEVAYFVTRVSSGQEVLLIVSDLSIKEKNRKTKQTLFRWSLKSVESCERTKSDVLCINFNTIKKDRKERNYQMPPDSCQKLQSYLRDFLASRPLSEMNQIVYKCANCTTQFCREIGNQQIKRDIFCPECKSEFVIEMHESPPEKGVSLDSQATPVQVASSAEAATDQNSSIALATVLRRSPLNTKLRSAGSINESSSCSKISNNGSFDSNQSVAGSSTSERDRDPDIHLSSRFNAESDVEILSNPSQSSIEVLDSKNSSRKHSEERKISHVPSLETITDHSSVKEASVLAEEKIRPNLAEKKDLIRQTFLNLTESSSSGSITDSICTAYEHSQEAEEHKHLSPVEVISEEDNRTQSSFFGFLSAFATTNKVDGIVIPIADPFKFTFDDFGNVDHRIQVYLYQHIFMENSEKLLWVVRCRFCDEKISTEWFDGIVVMSTVRFYTFIITGEENDDPSKWLRRLALVPVEEMKSIKCLPWSVGVTFSTRHMASVHILLRDSRRTQSFFKFLQKSTNCRPVGCSVVAENQEDLLQTYQNESIRTFAIFEHCERRVDETKLTVSFGGIIVTEKTFHMTSGGHKWMTEKGDPAVGVVHTQLLQDMVELEPKSDTEFILNFLDERENKCEQWFLRFATPAVVQDVLAAIREPWERLFEVHLIANS